MLKHKSDRDKITLQNRFLAICLVSLFLYPIFFQSTHTLYIAHHHHNIHHEHSPVFKHQEKQCPICSYEFPPSIESVYNFVSIDLNKISESPIQYEFIALSILNPSFIKLRAPPKYS